MAQISQSKGKVLVLGDDLRSFLSVIRSLGRRGLRVEVGWCAPDCPARFSRYVSRFHVLPPYSAKDSGWKLAFKRLLQSEDFDLVIPCDDPRIIPLQFNRAELEPLARIYLLEDRAFQITSNKLASHQLAKELGVPVPRSVQLSRLDSDRLLRADRDQRPFLLLTPTRAFRWRRLPVVSVSDAGARQTRVSAALQDQSVLPELDRRH